MNSIYQYSVPIENRAAYLWIPPECKQVRGVIISLANLLERRWLEDPIIRKGTVIAAAISSDGRSWKIVGMKEVPMKKQVFIGIAAASVVNGVSTTVKFDHVIVSR